MPRKKGQTSPPATPAKPTPAVPAIKGQTRLTKPNPVTSRNDPVRKGVLGARPKKERDAEWGPESDALRDEIADTLMSPLDAVYEDYGLTMEAMAVQRVEQLRAVQVTHQKLKGIVDPETLAPGYQVVAQAFGGEGSDGETLVAHTSPDFPIRQRATDAVEKNRGWAGADRLQQEGGGTTIIVHPQIPEPMPLPAGLVRRLEGGAPSNKGEGEG
jgi:hypothetical protein